MNALHNAEWNVRHIAGFGRQIDEMLQLLPRHVRPDGPSSVEGQVCGISGDILSFIISKKGCNYVFEQTPASVFAQIASDYRQTGKCRLAMANVNFGWLPMYMVTGKWFPHQEQIATESVPPVLLT